MIITGIGSRRTPRNVLDLMSHLGSEIVSHNYIIRSGGAPGADTAFELPARLHRPDLVEVYLPWPKFNGRDSQFTGPTQKAILVVSELLKYWPLLAPSVQMLHSRNVHQLLGINCNTPSDIVICWTPDGASSFEECTKHTGGTGTAIKLASVIGVPIVNLQRYPLLQSFQSIIDHVAATRISTDPVWDQ